MKYHRAGDPTDTPGRRRAALEEAFAAGKMGSPRPPDTALMAVHDPSDTFIHELLDAHARGRLAL